MNAIPGQFCAESCACLKVLCGLCNVEIMIYFVCVCVLFCSKLCADDLTAFEPEACSQMVTGMDFHKFYFDNSELACLWGEF